MKKRLYIWITLTALLVLGSTIIFLLLPYLFDIYLSPRLIAELPFTQKKLSISRLSPWETRGTLILANNDQPTLSIPRFDLHYTPASLLHGKIAEVILDSASLQIEIQNGHAAIKGFPFQTSSSKQENKTSPFILPLAVETIILKNCSITFEGDFQYPVTLLIEGQVSLSFLEQPEKKKLLSALSGRIQSHGALDLDGEFGLKLMESGYQSHLQLQLPDIGQIPNLVPELKDARLKGSLSINGNAHIDQLLNQITGYEATVKLPGFRYSQNKVVFQNMSEQTPLTLQISGNAEQARYTLANVTLTEPEKSTLDLKGEMNISERTYSGISHLLFERTHASTTISYNGKNQKSGTSINYRLDSNAFTLDDTLSVSPFTAEGKVDFDGATFVGTLNSRIPEIALNKSETKLINVSLQLPFRYPVLSEGTAGELTIKEIQYQGIKSGSIRANLTPSPKGVAFTTLFTTPFIAHLQLTCEGSAQVTQDISVHCRLPETQFDSVTFPDFVQLPEKLSIKGKLAAVGDFHVSDIVAAGKLKIEYHDGTLLQGENKLSDINVGVVFPNLPLLQSDPDQLFTIGVLDFGKIKLSKARINFRIENEKSIFIEKVLAGWCGGKVETGSFKLARDMKEVETTLYCDRLGFTELLAQFGINKTEGQGSLNGRIPMIVSKKGVIFDDGFLFSTPGNSGIVRFTDTKQLLQGMPKANNSAYLDYSMKALENFSYNWTKLSFNSQKDDLLITMQLDGKPADPLPFGYKNGQIVPSDQGPGLQHPIRLDVNFRLPMQDLFRYGKNIKSIMENM